MRSDRDLEQRFDALRRADTSVAPAFGAIVRRPARRRRAVGLRAALVAATLVLAIGGIRLATQPTPAEIPTILTWRSPTAELLRTPGQDLLRDIPTLGSSLLSDRPNPGAR